MEEMLGGLEVKFPLFDGWTDGVSAVCAWRGRGDVPAGRVGVTIVRAAHVYVHLWDGVPFFNSHVDEKDLNGRAM